MFGDIGSRTVAASIVIVGPVGVDAGVGSSAARAEVETAIRQANSSAIVFIMNTFFRFGPGNCDPATAAQSLLPDSTNSRQKVDRGPKKVDVKRIL